MDKTARLCNDAFPDMETLPQTNRIPRVDLPGALPPEPLSIADMAELFGVTHRTLHFYEEKGLISSNRSGSMRVYSHNDVMRMAVVSACREGGMPVAIIQEMLNAMNEVQTSQASNAIFRETLLSCRRELTAGISTIRRQMQQIENLLTQVVPNEVTGDMSCPAFTETERHCLSLMASGASADRMSTTLAVSVAEVTAMEKDIILRLGASNRSQAIAKALLSGMIENQ